MARDVVKVYYTIPMAFVIKASSKITSGMVLECYDSIKFRFIEACGLLISFQAKEKLEILQ